jgi:hypothetical protein
VLRVCNACAHLFGGDAPVERHDHLIDGIPPVKAALRGEA